MSYGLSHIVHLFCAFLFIGAVFFEVLILGNARKQVPTEYMHAIQQAITYRSRRLILPAVLVIFLTGTYMASVHFTGVQSPFDTSLSTLLSIKILIASSVLIHVIVAMTLSLRGAMNPRRFKLIHLSVFSHMVLIILLAKGMFYLSW